MFDVAAEFEKLLNRERTLALRADVDGLNAIQDEKRDLLEQLRSAGVPGAEGERLQKLALANVQLIRHLVACFKGLSQPPGPTYNAGGDRPSMVPGRSWGRL